jgi:hypothetical protein
MSNDSFNPNVMSEGDGRMEIHQEGDRVFCKLVWDEARAQEIAFLLGPRDAIAVGKALQEAGEKEEQTP